MGVAREETDVEGGRWDIPVVVNAPSRETRSGSQQSSHKAGENVPAGWEEGAPPSQPYPLPCRRRPRVLPP